MSKLIAEFSCFISNSLWIFVQFDADLIEELTNGFKKIMEGFLPVFEVRFHVKVLNPPPPSPSPSPFKDVIDLHYAKSKEKLPNEGHSRSVEV